MSDWFETLEGLHAACWALLQAKDGAARQPTLATVSPAGWPEARTVVLRNADGAAGTCEIHTERDSGKARSIAHTPRAALHVWEPGRALQLRLVGIAELVEGSDRQAAWAAVPLESRNNYGAAPPTGTPIGSSLDYRKLARAEDFALLRITLTEIDVLHLGAQHRRARFTRQADWAGQWLSP